MRIEPEQIWWTADELADAQLPDLPGTKRGINHRADQFGWRAQPGCARRKPGRGGGWQYHWTLLPAAAQRKLLAAPLTAKEESRDRGRVWAEFDSLDHKAKDAARTRLEAIRAVEMLQSTDVKQVAAIAAVAHQQDVSSRTLYNWIGMIDGVAEEDRLAYLAPRHKLANRKAVPDTDVRPFMDWIKGLLLRIAPQTFRQCYRMAVKKAKAEGWGYLTEKTAKRRFEKEVPRVTRVFAQEGVEGLERCFPAQIRDRSDLGALGAVSADCHKIDVFVEWPDGTIDRPQVVVFQDLYSNKLLSWRVDHSPNKVMVMSAFGELVERYGIPRKCQFDNGREFANKWMTGGAPTRFRFKVRPDDPLGVLPIMGIDIHWARPGRGQSKPIERAFRDIASDVSKDPRFEGAYVGNRPDAKPENYGSRAIPVETFLKVLDEGIIEHNARQGRLTKVAAGRSFDEAFEESYQRVPIRKATEEQQRLWLMGQHVCNLNKTNGQIRFNGNTYHSDWMSEHPSRPVVARFDPEDLHAGLHVYDKDGAFLGYAECQQAVGFFDMASAHKRAARDGRIKRAEKALLKAMRPIDTETIAADLDARSPEHAADLKAKVVSPDFGKQPSRVTMNKPVYEPTLDPEVQATRQAIVHSFEPAPETKPKAKSARDESEARFKRARAIRERSDAGDRIGKADADWLRGYVETAEFQGLSAVFESHGKGGISRS